MTPPQKKKKKKKKQLGWGIEVPLPKAEWYDFSHPF